MSPDDLAVSVMQISDGIMQNKAERAAVQGGGLGTTKRPFYITFGPEVSDNEAIEILGRVRALHPDLRINGTRQRVRR